MTTVLMLIVAVFLWGVVEPVQGDGNHTVGYEALLFDQSVVHTVDITMEDWDGFISKAMAEEYTQCSIAIDGEKYHNVAIRAKGNTSLSSVASMGSTRYSFKVEFDHYVKGMSYHGLDKISLNNLIQDATMMKDHLAYTLMNRMNVPSSLCSYVQINVNGEPWGLYLAVEGVEEAFLERNGMTQGQLYKPDSMSFGGGRGNGQDFSFEQFRENGETDDVNSTNDASSETKASQQSGESGSSFGGSSGAPGNRPEGDFASSGTGSAQETMPAGFDTPGAPNGEGMQPNASQMPGGAGGGFNFGMGNDDVMLIYSDDDPDSYSNIFNNAKTNVSKKDKTRLIETLRKLNAKEDLDNTVEKDEVIRYLAVHNFLCNDDSYTGMMVHNYYLFEEKGKLSIIPWDYNLAFGGFSASSNATSTVNSPIDAPVSGGTVDSRPLIAWIFSDEDALAEYHAAYDRFITENIKSGWLEEEISRIQELITPYLEQDSSTFYNMEEFEKGISTLRTFCQKRGESIRGQLDGTIPFTAQGQRENQAALVDASGIATSDMGSMNTAENGGGFGMPGGRGEMPNMEGFTPPSGPSAQPNQENGNSFGGSAGSSGERAQTEQAEGAQNSAPNQAAAPEGMQSGSPNQAAAPEGAWGRPDFQQRYPSEGTPSSRNQSGQWV